jgi:potassium-dependent mechanosensitive channel
MTRLLARLGLVAALAFATVAGVQEGRAQDAGAAPVAAPSVIDYEAFTLSATDAERLVADPGATDDELEAMRATLSGWRSQLLAAQGANQTTVDRLQAQMDALGPVPAEGSGVTESAEITERRAELNRQMAEAQTPRVTAFEAFNRADGLVAEIDAELRERQRRTLIQRAPSPLMPASLAAAGKAVAAVAGSIRTEVRQQNLDAELRADVRDSAVALGVLSVVGFVLLLWGRQWIGSLSSLVHRKRARATLVFIVSLGQVLVPVVGAILVLVGIVTTGIAGEKVSHLLGGVIGLLITSFAALWLAGRLFPADESEPAALELPGSGRRIVRRITVAIGVILGVGSVLNALVAFEEVGEAARAVFLLPYFLLLSVAFWALANVLSKGMAPAVGDESSGFVARLVAIIVTALRIVAIAGPVFAVAGFTNAANGVMRPTALSLGLLGLFLALQAPIRDLYALVTRTAPEEAGRALVPVLVNFALAGLSLPVLAMIWGMRRSEIAEVWSRFQEGISLGGTRITPDAILTVILVFAVVLLVTRLVQGALKSTVLPRTRLDTGAQNAVAAGVGYIGIALAGLVAINAAGIDLTALAFVGAALSVGIGFGLRNVIENFVAGLILLIERPIGEGDWIEVGGNMGIVKQISVRSTVIETFDKQQLIVPNGDFITGTVTNWTRGSQVGRAVITVGVGYGSDTRKVERILLEIARSQPGVMSYPEPGVDFMGFGASSLDFRVRAILYDVNTLGSVRTEMHHQILERFRAEGIEIPFAQRDIWLRNPEALGAAREGAEGRDRAEEEAMPERKGPPEPPRPLRREPEGIEAAAEQDGEAR